MIMRYQCVPAAKGSNEFLGHEIYLVDSQKDWPDFIQNSVEIPDHLFSKHNL